MPAQDAPAKSVLFAHGYGAYSRRFSRQIEAASVKCLRTTTKLSSSQAFFITSQSAPGHDVLGTNIPEHALCFFEGGSAKEDWMNLRVISIHPPSNQFFAA
jgi:hypothetical protein